MATQTLLVSEVAKRLGVDRAEVYRLLRTGALEGRPDRAGDMRVSSSSVAAYETSTSPTG